MRHGKKFNHLGRKTAHRSAMLSNMACSLLTHKRIKTTVAKAKALRLYVEPIITRSKEDSTHSRRVVFGYLQDKDAVAELFRDIAPKIADRPGGYTRIIKLGSRSGDSAEMCFIELVDYNDLMLADKSAKKTTRRSRRGGSKTKASAEGQTAAPAKTATKAATPAVDKKVEETKSETPAAEAKQEAPKAEAKQDDKAATAEAKKEEAPKAEVKEEKEPKTEANPEVKAEKETKEEPKADASDKGDEEKKEDKDGDKKE